MTNKNNKPALTEQTFDKLLEAAYVLQEHNLKAQEVEQSLESRSAQLRLQELEHQAFLTPKQPSREEPSASNGDYTLTLAEIVEAQRQIQIHHLGLDNSMAVVAERVARITSASGAGIGILKGKIVQYRAAAGASALPIGTEKALDAAICVASVRTGKVIRSEDINTEFLFDPELCRQRGILSLLAVPIYHDGDIVGALELYFDRIHGFAEQDTHTCQLMAGLVTEAISRDAELSLRKSLATERSSTLAAMELPSDAASIAEQEQAMGTRLSRSAKPIVADLRCWKCGGNILAEEQFCGTCGAPRASDSEPSTLQRTVASAWYVHRARQEAAPAVPSSGTALGVDDMRWPSTDDSDRVESAEDEGVEVSQVEVDRQATLFRASTAAEPAVTSVPSETEQRESVKIPSTALAVPQGDAVWSSAARARDFLESVSSGTREPGALARFWRSRRGDFYLALALILVVAVIRWGIWSDHAASGAGGTTVAGSSHRRKIDPNADLSAFDKLLIALGLAEAPDAPEYRGNPETQVWVDPDTALYYCPGSDLYGKTSKGKMSSQRDAQLDQFEPAYRKPCD